ncbi:MAG: hypothetical protein J0I04_02450 [Paenarthrobacter ureafaciens]|uniref:hypothetical protein n=1 Tax=Paenarthrobacter ureafaciens TaxID=37931 RepID=UPI001AC98C9F|nr:hypothetical protein [Paenarthrobacter ureafaciens]MBN9128499.1 hypothetical protein [Paenarthrobacter ureafaciens]
MESKATLLAAQGRAEAHVNLVQGQLDTARTTLLTTLRAALIAGTTVGTTLDTASSDVARLEKTLWAAKATLLELSNQISIA